jgi:hypothetical protein
VNVMRLDGDGQWFDFARECGSGSAYAVTIDARRASPYAPADPYGASGAPMACPPLPADAGSPTYPVPDGGDGGPSPPTLPDADAGQAPPGSADAGSPWSGGGDTATPLVPAAAAGCACSAALASSHAADAGGALLAIGAVAGVARRRHGPRARRQRRRGEHEPA